MYCKPTACLIRAPISIVPYSETLSRTILPSQRPEHSLDTLLLLLQIRVHIQVKRRPDMSMTQDYSQPAAFTLNPILPPRPVRGVVNAALPPPALSRTPRLCLGHPLTKHSSYPQLAVSVISIYIIREKTMIYGYIRVSSDKQTVENQRFEVTNFCARNNLAIDGWIEETISGTKSYDKRALGKLL